VAGQAAAAEEMAASGMVHTVAEMVATLEATERAEVWVEKEASGAVACSSFHPHSCNRSRQASPNKRSGTAYISRDCQRTSSPFALYLRSHLCFL